MPTLPGRIIYSSLFEKDEQWLHLSWIRFDKLLPQTVTPTKSRETDDTQRNERNLRDFPLSHTCVEDDGLIRFSHVPTYMIYMQNSVERFANLNRNVSGPFCDTICICGNWALGPERTWTILIGTITHEKDPKLAIIIRMNYFIDSFMYSYYEKKENHTACA